MPRAIWSGAISFGLVNVPVKLYSATSPAVPASGGGYYDLCAVREPNPVATPELAELLWQRSATWAGVG